MPYDTDSYNDIINLKRPLSHNAPLISDEDRAAQFAPFAALTGHDEELSETARLTDSETRLCEDAAYLLNEKLCIIRDNPGEIDTVIEYFIPDKNKPGGKYVLYRGRIIRIDEDNGVLITQSKEKIPIEHIIAAELENCDTDRFNCQ